MIKICTKYVLIFLIGQGLYSCKENRISDAEEAIQVSAGHEGKRPNFEYNGQSIKIKNSVEEGKIGLQEIEQQKEDIYFRAKKINTKDYLVQKGLNNIDLEEALDELKGEQLFYIEFEEVQKRDLMKKYHAGNMDESVSYLAFTIDQDFILVNESLDSLSANYSLYERNFHVAPYERIILSFNNVKEEEALELIYSDKLFNKGKMHFYFPTKKDIINYTSVL